MAVIPYSLGGNAGNAAGGYGYGLKDTSLDDIYAQGRVQQSLQQQQLANQLAQADRSNATQLSLADKQNAGQLSLADIGADTARRSQDLGYQQAMRGYDVQGQGNQLQAQTAQRGQELTYGSNMRGFDVQQQGNQLAADTNRRGQDTTLQAQLAGIASNDRGNQIQADTARHGQDLQLQAALAPVDFAKQRFSSILPLLQSQLAGGAVSAGGGGGGGGAMPAPPGGWGVYAPGQVDQQVNAARAGIDQSVGGAQRRMAADLAGRGFGGNSPLLLSQSANAAAQGLAAGADSERQIRQGAAEAEGQQKVSVGQLMNQRYATDTDADVRRRQIAASAQSNILSALAGLA